jgi:glycosyltransferase involved in cell wall biosynthesis
MVELTRSLEAQVEVVPAGRVRDLPRLLRVARSLGGILRRVQPDIVVSWMSKAHLYAAPAAGLLGIPAAWFQHGLPKASDPIDRLVALAPAARVLACSQFVAGAQEAIWPHRPVRVIHPGIDTDRALLHDGATDRARAALGIPAGAPVVGMVGRLQRWKGMHVLVEAMPDVLRGHPDAHAVIVGGEHPLEPGYRADLELMIEDLKLSGRVHLAGYQPDARAWMAGFDVAVHASEDEPFGIVVLEAMALARPLVAGAGGGPSEFVRDGVEGFLVPFGDAGALARRIVRYLDDPALARRMGAAAAERASAFTARRFADQVVGELRTHARLAA